MGTPARLSSARPNKRRNYPGHRVRSAHCYDVAEISRLFGIHKNTVRQWLKEGLHPIDEGRPILIHGTSLKAFISKRRNSKKQNCGLDELFCFRCRVPRRPWNGLFDVISANEKVARLTAICGSCETIMHRTVRWGDIPKIEKLMQCQELPLERLDDCLDPSSNSDLKRNAQHVETQSGK